jgi:hypothetical protein
MSCARIIASEKIQRGDFATSRDAEMSRRNMNCCDDVVDDAAI